MILITINHWINSTRGDDDRLMEYVLKWIDVYYNNNASFESTTVVVIVIYICSVVCGIISSRRTTIVLNERNDFVIDSWNDKCCTHTLLLLLATLVTAYHNVTIRKVSSNKICDFVYLKYIMFLLLTLSPVYLFASII